MAVNKNNIKVMFRKVKNAEYPAEFYWDDELALYKRGNTTSVMELSDAPLTDEGFTHHFFKLFGELLRYHKGDELAQVGFFLPHFNSVFDRESRMRQRYDKDRKEAVKWLMKM